MPFRCRVSLPLLLLVAAFACRASAADIKMRNGVVYQNVTVLRQTASTLEFRSAYGSVTVPLSMVSQIGGIPVTGALDNSPGQAGPNPTPTWIPGKRVIGEPLASLSPPPTPKATATPARAAASPAATVPPKVVAAARPAPPAKSGSLTAALFEQLSKIWPLLLMELGFIALWGLTVVLVQRELRVGSPEARRWLYVTVLLPIIGYLLRKLSGISRRKSGSEAPYSAVDFEFLDAEHRAVEITSGAEASGLEHAKDVLTDAMLDRASDVHIEPGSDEYRIRFRMNGQLRSRMKFPAAEGLRLVSAIKSVSQIDISERRKAQDGRFGARSRGREVDFRVATTPTVYGEKLVLRILDHRTGLRGLDELGMAQSMLERFAQVIHSRSGMILATGPTGSGKTSTLYTALSQLDAANLNLVTIEDPVEYQLSGATQIPVNVRTGVTYEAGLRSILRQDPDVILVGEMRDLEAAKIALRSALTGHLVFSSLHARDAISTVMRLEEMGVERHLIASSLFVVIAQRLVRVLCQECRVTDACKGDELLEIGIQLPEGETIYRAGGCRQCDGSGYTERTGVFEMVVFDDEMRQGVNGGMDENELVALARTKGYRPYREDAAQKILMGVTSVDEVLKAV